MQDLLSTENLVELHKKLDEFAKYHQNKGGQEAHKFIKAMWDENRASPRNGEKEAILRDEGYDLAMKNILDELHKKFIP